jgi:hypothetical protein
MAWIMFWFLLAAFSIVLGLVAYSAFFTAAGAGVSVGLVLLDGVVGLSLRQVVAYLFPTVRPRSD